MPYKCCVFGCSNAEGFRFPRDRALRNRWVVAVRRDKWTPTLNNIVCYDHFRPVDYLDGPTSRGSTRCRKVLRSGAVPSSFQWSKKPTEADHERCLRAQRQQTAKQKACMHSQDRIVTDSCPDEHCYQTMADFCDVEVEVTDTGIDENTDQLQNGHIAPVMTVGTQTALGLSPPPVISLESLQSDKELLHYYTGLESAEKVLAVFQTLGPAVYHLKYLRTVGVSNLTPINQFLLMLARLRQDLDYLPLSRLCGVSKFTAENVFLTWVNFCSRQRGEINMWASKDLVKYNIPTDFNRKFPSTRVILDGTEIPVEKPSNPISQRATFSTYKNTNTVKVVVGCSPGGMVSYISPAYGGSASDRQIIERSGLPALCDPGDSVMADKGFNVQDLFATHDVKVNIPAFFRKKNRLSEKQVLDDRKVASKRVHIERIIGMAKTYKILVNGLNAPETKLARHITFVCFMLCNFRNNIVSKNA